MDQQTSDPGTVQERWRAVPDGRLRFRYWDDECVLYHGAAGDTHRLPAVVGQLLQALEQAGASIGDLSARIDLHEDDVRDALRDLRHLGIVERLA